MRSLNVIYVAVLMIVVMFGCGNDDGMGPDSITDVSGSWQGISVFTRGVASSMNLQQVGSSVTGTIFIAGSALKTGTDPVDGEIDAFGRFVWTARPAGCTFYSGTLTLSSDGLELTGPITSDGLACSTSGSSIGNMRLDKE